MSKYKAINTFTAVILTKCLLRSSKFVKQIIQMKEKILVCNYINYVHFLSLNALN